MAEVFSHLNRMDEKALKRFLAKTRSSSGCWLWTGAKDKDGYGTALAKERIEWPTNTGKETFQLYAETCA